MNDVIEGGAPFTNGAAWLRPQQECPDLRWSHARLSQGIQATKITDIKRYNVYLQDARCP